eukprot:TRINITY_DN2229_c0_g1_i1.p1 TRINITY_DN2229_c0_g1~~TRINITY_DN2229_c0_g1_i1.p1  ORF type:complete len:235 (+),score=11.67 TRINITY_DN2229_c0_g1_i1:469-1173(+)
MNLFEGAKLHAAGAAGLRGSVKRLATISMPYHVFKGAPSCWRKVVPYLFAWPVRPSFDSALLQAPHFNRQSLISGCSLLHIPLVSEPGDQGMKSSLGPRKGHLPSFLSQRISDLSTKASRDRPSTNSRGANVHRKRSEDEEIEDEDMESGENSGKSRGPTKTVHIYCAKCRALLYKYRKGGNGALVKCFVERIAEDYTNGDMKCGECGGQFARMARIRGKLAHKIIGGKVVMKK